MLDPELATFVSFTSSTILLAIYSYYDFRTRRVSNQMTYGGMLIGFVIVVLTGHFFMRLLVHVTAVLFFTVISILLFRFGAIGGADVKALLTIAIVSPGLEFRSLVEPFYDGLVIGGIELVLMFVFGIIYSRYLQRPTSENERTKTPLIPMLLLAYLVVQLLGFLL